MTDFCARYEAALLAADADALGALSPHANACAACRRKRELWKGLERVAPSLRKSWESPDLLARIQDAAERSPRVVPFAPRRVRWSSVLGVAAVITLLSFASWVAVRNPPAPRPGFGLPELPEKGLISDSELKEVEKTEEAYRASIADLERRAGPRLENASSPLLVNTKEKLLVLDTAIAEARREVEQNELNTNLRRALLAIYVEKRKTLQSLFPENGDRS